MSIHQFIVAVGSDPTDDQVEALFQLHDEPGAEGNPRTGLGWIHFLREAPNLMDAILSAVGDLETIGLRPVGIRDDDYVTLGDIARRIGRSRESVRLWAIGRVGPGDFPEPVSQDDSHTTFYRWIEVVFWLNGRMGFGLLHPDPTLHAANLALQLRALAPVVPRLDDLYDLLWRHESGGRGGGWSVCRP